MGKYQLYMQQWETEKSHWSDEAACKDADPNLFIVIERGSKLASRMSEDERVATNKENHEDAKSYCDRCPVVQDCMKNATDDDLEWTVRAGNSPVMFTGLPVGRPKGSGRAKQGSGRCGRGHWRETGTRCIACKREDRKAYKIKTKLNREAASNGEPLPHPEIKSV